MGCSLKKNKTMMMRSITKNVDHDVKRSLFFCLHARLNLFFPPHDPEAKTKTSFPLNNSTSQKHKPIQTYRQPFSCMMFSSTSASYQEQFPSFEKRTDPQTKVTTRPFVPSLVTPNGQTEEPRLFKAVLNWQFENARAQNSVLQSLDAKVDSVASQVHSTDGKVDSIAADESPCLSTGLRSSSDDKKQILGS